jgi:hypothetical protein
MPEIGQVLPELVGQPCTRAFNPYGSILCLDIGPLGHRADDDPDARQRGWRTLTVYSPWRLQTTDQIACDWNYAGGYEGEITPLIQPLVGQVVEMASAEPPPGWDLRIRFSGGLTLITFSDREDVDRKVWTILGTDGLQLLVEPVFADDRLP